MKFSYRVNERMYLEAFNLRFWKLRVKVIFGVLVVIALLEILILSLSQFWRVFPPALVFFRQFRGIARDPAFCCSF